MILKESYNGGTTVYTIYIYIYIYNMVGEKRKEEKKGKHY